MTFRIIHFADLHLDIPFSGLGRNARTSQAHREGLRLAFKRTLDIARTWPANAVTIGGDLYEADHVTPDTVEFLRQQFEQAAPLRIFIAPGNHDPHTHSSPYARVNWPPNVHIFGEPKLMPVPLADKLTLWGAGHDSAEFTKPLLSGFRLPDSTPSILLLHGTDQALTLGQGKRTFCPFSADEIRAAGFGLALLGHIHHQRIQKKDGHPLLCYPGSPEPLGFDEEVGHSILRAEWTGDGWQVEPLDISQWLYRANNLDVGGLASRDSVIESLRGMWAAERRGKHCLARVELCGQPTSSLDLDLGAIRAALEGEYEDLILEDATLPPFDLAALQGDQTVTGVFVRRMLAEIARAELAGDPPRQAVLKKALAYGLMVLDNREIRSP